MIQRWTPLVVLGAAAVTLWASPILADIVWPLARTLAVAVALLWIPGDLCCRALRVDNPVSGLDRAALCFAVSLGLWAGVSAALLLLALPLSSATGLLIALMAVLALTASLGRCDDPIARKNSDGRSPERAAGSDERALAVFALAAGALVTLAAWHFTASGAVDRWWYLAYVRSFLEAPAIDFRDPLLGTGNVIGRFAFNPWLLMLSMWARSAAVDPVWLYERAAPLVLAPLAFCSALLFGRSLFGCSRTAWATASASCLLWASASLFPLLARAPEDKILALLILSPTLLAVLIRTLASANRGWAVMLAIIVVALVTTHSLVYAVVMLSALPFLLLGFADPGDSQASGTAPRSLTLSLVVVVLGGAAALALGSLAKEGLEATGVLLADPTHPVVRVHQARQRLIELGGGSYMVNPRLLAHPLTIAALAGLPLVRRRTTLEQRMLVPATILALALAFVPPLSGLVGQVLFPWMVYRVLWAIPMAALIAVFIDEASRRLSVKPVSVCIVLAIVIAPWVRDSLLHRSSEQRQALALPDSPAFRETLNAIAALPKTALLAAPSELAERLPALTGTRVLSASDRATIVFAASRSSGEARLRANAAISAALWKPSQEAPTPTHLLYAPGSAAEHYCAERLYANSEFVLCRFQPAAPEPGVKLHEQPARMDSNEVISLARLLAGKEGGWSVECEPEPKVSPNRKFLLWRRPGPWSARTAIVDCTITRQTPSQREPWWRPSALVLEPVLGTAVDEFTLALRGQRDGIQRWNLRTRKRVTHGQTLSFSLPRGAVDSMRVRVIPTFLPFIKLAQLGIALEPRSTLEER